MEKIPATVGILTFNSEQTLERTLHSVQDFAEILIVDGGSTDATLEIASRYGATIIDQPQKGRIKDFSVVRNHALSHGKYDWYFSLDADETASEVLVEEIREIVHRDKKPFVYRMPMGLMYCNRDIVHYSSLPGYQFRFFCRRSGARYIKPVHERITFDDQEIGMLQGKWHIYMDENEVKEMTRFEHLASDVLLLPYHSLPSFLYFAFWRNILAIIYTFLFVIRARVLHRWSKCAPIKIEWLIILYKIKIIASAFRQWFKRSS